MHQVSKKRKLVSYALAPFGDLIFKFVNRGPYVLLYHSVYNNNEKHLVTDNWSISKNEFEKHLKVISKYFTPISIELLAASIKNKQALDPQWVAITFDDGFNNVISNAVPLLKKYNIPWTFCIPSLCVEEKRIPWQTELSIIDHIIDKDDQLRKKIFKIACSFSKQKIDEFYIKKQKLKLFVTKNVKVPERYKIISRLKKIIPEKEIQPINDFYSMVTWTQLKNLKNDLNSKVNFAIHGGLHLLLNKEIKFPQINLEIIESKLLFEDRLDQCNTFSIVGGIIDEKLIEMLETAGYSVCLTSGISNSIKLNEKIVSLPRMIGEFSRSQLFTNMLLNQQKIKKW